MKKLPISILLLSLVLTISFVFAQETKNQPQVTESKPNLLDTVSIFEPFTYPEAKKDPLSELKIWSGGVNVWDQVYIINVIYSTNIVGYQGSAMSISSTTQSGLHNSVTIQRR